MEWDNDSIEEWAENFFTNTVNMLSGFIATLPLAEVIKTIEGIPFEQLVREQLRDEEESVIQLAVEKVMEHKQAEIRRYRAYLSEK